MRRVPNVRGTEPKECGIDAPMGVEFDQRLMMQLPRSLLELQERIYITEVAKVAKD